MIVAMTVLKSRVGDASWIVPSNAIRRCRAGLDLGGVNAAVDLDIVYGRLVVGKK